IDVEAATDDQVLLALDDEEEVVRVEASHVARVEPAAANRLRRLLRIPVVADHDVGPLHTYLAQLAHGHGRPVIVADGDRHAREGRSHRAQLANARETVSGHDRRSLGEPVALQELPAEAALERFYDLDGKRGRTRAPDAHSRGVVGGGPRI